MVACPWWRRDRHPGLLTRACTHVPLSTVKEFGSLLMMCALGRVLQLLADGRPVPPVRHDTEAGLPCEPQ